MTSNGHSTRDAPGISSSSLPKSKPLPEVPWHRKLFSTIVLSSRRLVRYWWAWEILSAAFSLAATVALVTVLAEQDGHIQEPFKLGATQVTLNTIIAAISTAIRTSLALAVAGPLNQSAWNWFSQSRHPGRPLYGQPLKDLDTFGDAAADSWSSLKLLWRTKCTNLASFGAIIVILSLAFDTFAQQVLVSQTRTVVSSDSKSHSSLPRAISYEDVFEGVPAIGDVYAPLDLQGTLISSIFNTNVSYPDSPCATGNCTWPRTPTIGVCSSCTDIKDKLQIANVSITSGNSLLPGVKYSIPLYQEDARYTSAAISIYYLLTNNTDPNAYSNLSIISFLPSENLSPTETNSRILISTFLTLGVPPTSYFEGAFLDLYTPLNQNIPGSYWYSDQSLPLHAKLDRLVTAYNCSLYFCLQTYEGHTTRGVTHQRRSSTWASPRFFETTDNPLDPPVPAQYYGFENVPPNMGILNPSAYIVDGYSLAALTAAVQPLLTGNATIYDPSNIIQYGSSGGLNTLPGLTQTVQNMLNSTTSLDRISAQAEQISDALTAYIRTTLPAAPDARFAPTVLEEKTVIRVRWPWLSFPLTLLVAGYVFLGLTIWHTRRLRVRPWKGQRTAFLLAGVNDTIKRFASGGLESRNGLEDRVGEMRVYMAYDDEDEIAFKRVVRTSSHAPL